MNFSSGVVLVLGFVALLIVVLNDMGKKQTVNKARNQNKKSTVDMLNNNTQWGFVLAIAIGICASAYLLNNPELMKEMKEGDWGPLTPLVKHFLEEPPQFKN